MCAGISFLIDKVLPAEFDKFLLPQEFSRQRKGDMLTTFFWQREPFLPVLENGKIYLYKWGNREKNIKLPRTGWAKIETVRDGRWDWLSPKTVIIPSCQGYEKKKWFATPRGIKGLKVRYHNLTRIYILTTKANQNFLTQINHDRMPILINNY